MARLQKGPYYKTTANHTSILVHRKRLFFGLIQKSDPQKRLLITRGGSLSDGNQPRETPRGTPAVPVRGGEIPRGSPAAIWRGRPLGPADSRGP